MSSVRLAWIAIALCLVVLSVAGCARPVVKQTVDGGGMPGPLPPGPAGGPVSVSDIETVQASLKLIYFDYDSYALSPQAQADAQYNADILKRAPNMSFVAEGHCDERGTGEYNLALGDRRARAVVDYLVGLGLSPQRFSTVSYGAELPVDPGHNDAAWSKNRRVHLGVSR
jgi:peptidoglycan-associated lipoprotein